MLSNGVIRQCRVKAVETYNKIKRKMKRLFAFVSNLFAMSHDERECCLKRRTAPRIMYVSHICWNIVNENVSSGSAFIDMMRGREQVLGNCLQNIVCGKLDTDF